MTALLIGLTGPPVSGKSTTIASAAPWAEANGKKIAVACMPAAESDTSGYAHPACEVECFEDPDWNPHYNDLKAEGYMKLMRWLRGLEKREDIAVVGMDTVTAASELAEHQNCATMGIAAMSDADHGRGYTGTTDNMRHMVTQLKRLKYKFGKHIICSFHVVFKEMQGAGDAVEVKDMSSGKTASGEKLARVRWESRLQPMVTGVNAYASKIAGEFSLLLSTEVDKGKGWLRVLPDETGLQRSRVKLHAPPGEKRPEKVWMQQIPNDFAALMGMVSPNGDGK